jgi:hypothetical protein
MRGSIWYVAAGLLLAACQDREEETPSGPNLEFVPSSAVVSVSEGIFAPPQVKPGQQFQLGFTLRNIGSLPGQYAEVALAILRPDGAHLYDAGHWTNIAVSVGGTWNGNVVTSLSAGLPPGMYRAVVRGRVPGGNWFEFPAQGASNPLYFTVTNGGAFAAVISGINVYPSSVAPGMRPRITAVIRNTATADTPWQGHATFIIRAVVRRSGTLVKQQEWTSQAFAYSQSREGFEVGANFNTSTPGVYEVEYRVLTGDAAHLLALRRESFWVESAVAQAACTPPREAVHDVSYRSFAKAPYGFRGATPWLVALHDAAHPGAESRIEIDFIRLWGRASGVDRVISSNEYEDGRFGGELLLRDSTLGATGEGLPGTIVDGVLVIRPSDRKDRVWHPYLDLLPRADISRYTEVRLEIRYRITGPVLLQAGLDYWKYVDGTSNHAILDRRRLEEAAVTDWKCTSGAWQTARLERSTEATSISVAPAQAGQAMRVGVPLRATFSMRNFDDDSIHLRQVGIEARRVVTKDPYCDWKVSPRQPAFPWRATRLALAPSATFTHSSVWTPDTAGTYCLTVVEKRRDTPESLYQKVFYAPVQYRFTVAP